MTEIAAVSNKPYRDHEEATIESFRNDPHFGAEYLNAVLGDGDQQELMTALRYLEKAFGKGIESGGAGGAERDHALRCHLKSPQL